MFGFVTEDGNGNQIIKNLAGGMGDGLPLGTIIAFHRTVVPLGFLPCDGSEFSITDYPSLYTLLGSNKTPDLRECNLVGIGVSNRQTLSVHDVYTLGQFKDDQVQAINATIDTSGIEVTINDPGHTHSVTLETETTIPTGDNYTGTGTALFAQAEAQGSETYTGTSTGTISTETTGITAEITDGSVTATFEDYRHGATTHGKNYGVQYIIKATTGTIDVNDAEIYSQVVAFLEANYGKDDIENYQNNDLVRWDSENNKFVPVSRAQYNGQVLAYNAGSSTTTHTYHDIWVYDSNFYDSSLNASTEPEGTLAQTNTLGQAVLYNGSFYVKDTDWYLVTGFTSTEITNDGVAIADTDLIDALEAETLKDVTYTIYDEATTVVVDPYYEWKRNGSVVVHEFDTLAEYNAALAITEGNDGYIADGDIVIKKWVTDFVRGVDNE